MSLTPFRMGPGDWTFEQQRALASMYLGDYGDASAWAQSAIDAGTGDPVWNYATLAGAQALSGNVKDARETAGRLTEVMPAFSVSACKEDGPARVTDGWDLYWQGLREAGIPE